MAKRHSAVTPSNGSDERWENRWQPAPLYQLLDDAATRFPHHKAIHFLGRTLRYEQLAGAVERLAASLQEMGIGKGVHVALFLPNCPAYVISYYAILKTGAAVVNLNPLNASVEINALLQDCRPPVVITANLRLCLDKIIHCSKTTPIERILVVDFAAQMPALKGLCFRWLKRREIASSHPGTRYQPWEAAVQNPSARFTPQPINPVDDVALLQYTGGTTGIPKAAVLTHANLHANAMQCVTFVTPVLQPGQERFVGVLPLFHAFAMTTVMNLGIALGAELLLLPRFDIAMLAKTIRKHHPTAMPGVPAMYNAITHTLAKNRRLNTKSLKACISGGAPLPLEIKRRFEAVAGGSLVEGYGLTEASPVCACNPLNEPPRAGSIGLPFPGTRITIRDPQNPAKLIPAGEKGEICIHGPQVMRGYWQRPAENAAGFYTDAENTRWLRTGDIGILHPDGYIEVVDRLKEMIIVNGYNIYPRHIEEALYQHPAVLECAVAGLPDAETGQSVAAWVVLKPGHLATEATILEFLRARVARYAVPKTVTFAATLPKTLIGKVLKRELTKGARDGNHP